MRKYMAQELRHSFHIGALSDTPFSTAIMHIYKVFKADKKGAFAFICPTYIRTINRNGRV